MGCPHSQHGRGSSPLTRGGRWSVLAGIYPLGLIPAYAGRTMPGGGLISRVRAHPRLRGADAAFIAQPPRLFGSSPLTRGGPPCGLIARRPPGLIPAYAGRTWKAKAANEWPGAHPRLRGADNALKRASHHASGSSPLTRGGPARVPRPHPSAGLIPAYAGRTSSSVRSLAQSRAHPRLRGADHGRHL